jgi:hypothetical protein
MRPFVNGAGDLDQESLRSLTSATRNLRAEAGAGFNTPSPAGIPTAHGAADLRQTRQWQAARGGAPRLPRRMPRSS